METECFYKLALAKYTLLQGSQTSQNRSAKCAVLSGSFSNTKESCMTLFALSANPRWQSLTARGAATPCVRLADALVSLDDVVSTHTQL